MNKKISRKADYNMKKKNHTIYAMHIRCDEYLETDFTDHVRDYPNVAKSRDRKSVVGL